MDTTLHRAGQDAGPEAASTEDSLHGSDAWLDHYDRLFKYIKNHCPTFLAGSEPAVTKRRWFAKLRQEINFYGGVCDEKMKIGVMLARTTDKASEIAERHPEWRTTTFTFVEVWQKLKDLLVPADTPQKTFADLLALHQDRYTTGQQLTEEFEKLFDEIPEEVLQDPEQIKLCLYRFSLAPFYQQRLTEARITRYDEARGIIITLDRPPPGNSRTTTKVITSSEQTVNRMRQVFEPRRGMEKPYERKENTRAGETEYRRQGPKGITEEASRKICFRCKQPGHFIKDCIHPRV